MNGFRDRTEAGRRLAQLLVAKGYTDPVVLALPRGGVPVGLEVARALKAPLDLIMVRKLGVPFQPELAAGAVVNGAHPQIVVNADVASQAGLSRSDLEEMAEVQLEEIGRRRAIYLNRSGTRTSITPKRPERPQGSDFIILLTGPLPSASRTLPCARRIVSIG
jgi:putative phosphoribosyl transferase